MFYWFQRGTDMLRYEARTLLDAYELVIVAADGTEKVEHFGNPRALEQREAELLNELRREGWSGPHGWTL
jgi:hypothetical protein